MQDKPVIVAHQDTTALNEVHRIPHPTSSLHHEDVIATASISHPTLYDRWPPAYPRGRLDELILHSSYHSCPYLSPVDGVDVRGGRVIVIRRESAQLRQTRTWPTPTLRSVYTSEVMAPN